MPSGRVVTQTRARRRQSDAKWRAGVAMCYSIMKNAVPNQKKLGRRKISKALTIKETERHIVHLEKKLRELIQERAPMCGRAVMIETHENALVPAAFDDVRQDFAEKQHSLFVCTSHSGRKRYSVPPDIEANLEQMRQLSCELTVVNQSEAKTMYPQILKSKVISSAFKSKCSTTKEKKCTKNMVATFSQDASLEAVAKQQLTPLKKKVSKRDNELFVNKEWYTSTPIKVTTGGETQSSSQSSMYTSDGFTPVKLPYGLDKEDPMMALPGSPASSSAITPFSAISIPKTPLTPGSSMTNAEYFDLEHDQVTDLLCTESIDSMEIAEDSEKHTSDKNNLQVCKMEKTKCRRRLDRDYETEQTVPTSMAEDCCLDFDGYLLFHKQNSSLMDPACSQSEMALNIAHMWEKLEPDDRAAYSKMAALEQSDDSNDLSADLLGIDLRPLHKEQNETLSGIITLMDDTQEVPCLMTEIPDDIHKTLQLVEGFEDLGVLYPSSDDKTTLSKDFNEPFTDVEDGNQIVPQM